MTIKFYLDKPDQKAETAIYMFVRFGKTTLKFNTGKKIHPKYWNQKTPECHFRKFSGSIELNFWLNDLRQRTDKKYYSLISSQQPTIEEIRVEINQIITGQQPKDSSKEFKDALAVFIADRDKNKKIANATLKTYKSLVAHLLNFEAKSKHTLVFEGINKMFYEKFTAFLRTELNHTTNTVNKYIRLLKTFFNWAVENELAPFSLTAIKFKTKDDPIEIIHLTEEELFKIYNLELPKDSPLEKVRDVFCFGCFTGQRFSDILNIKRADLNGKYWSLHQIKVKDTLQTDVPLNRYAKEILEKYKDSAKPLPTMSNQKTNKYLKAIAELAGIDSQIKTVRYRGNERIETIEPKFKHIGTHTARRTFITICLEKKMRPETVMAISGHNDFRTMKKYIAITKKMKENEMNSVWG